VSTCSSTRKSRGGIHQGNVSHLPIASLRHLVL
jgi:hypothetical protein